MPTGRPDYWYGTALYFDDTPGDGEVTRGPTCNWAYDHENDPDNHHADFQAADAVTAMGAKAAGNPLHHDAFVPELLEDIEFGKDLDANVRLDLNFYSSTSVQPTFQLIRGSGWSGALQFYNNSIGDILFQQGSITTMTLKYNAGVEGIWDDTPTNGQVQKGVTSDWAFDHDADAAAHHSKYLDADAVSAMGAKGAGNPLHHDIYTDAEAELACEAIVDDTPVDGATDQPVSSNWAHDHAADANAHHVPTSGYVDRGDPASFDRTLNDWTVDTAWHDWDLSAIVGAGSRLVVIAFDCRNTANWNNWYFRKNGNSNAINVDGVHVAISNVHYTGTFMVETDSSGVVEYLLDNDSTWNVLNACVRGWWVL